MFSLRELFVAVATVAICVLIGLAKITVDLDAALGVYFFLVCWITCVYLAHRPAPRAAWLSILVLAWVLFLKVALA